MTASNVSPRFWMEFKIAVCASAAGLWASPAPGATATAPLPPNDPTIMGSSPRLAVSSSSRSNWHCTFAQRNWSA
eukprot:9052368-Lingulodinium_polyedra.AAC.1